MSTAVVLFTRDLRVHDHPALDAAVERASARRPASSSSTTSCSPASARRTASRSSSRRSPTSGARSRRAAAVSSSAAGTRSRRCSASPWRPARGAIHLSEDVSAFAQARQRRLSRAARERGIAVRTFPGVTVVPPGDLSPGGSGGPYRVFTPYWNRWRVAPRRTVLAAPASIPAVRPVDDGALPGIRDLTRGAVASNLPRGGETEGRSRLARWLRDGLADYDARRDDLAVEGTSGLSPYLHFGCLSPLEVAQRAVREPGGEAFVRQLCWRDFHHQLLEADPGIARRDFRPRHDRWRDDPDALAAWKEGRTGYPIVDAGMRQLRAEGTMHNRARLVTASFLAKHLYLDWRHGRGPLRAAPRRRRRGEQHRELAVGRGDGSGHAAQPRLQPDAAGASVRSRRRLRPPLGARARGGRRARRARALATRAPRVRAAYREPDRRPRGSRAAVPRRRAAA